MKSFKTRKFFRLQIRIIDGRYCIIIDLPNVSFGFIQRISKKRYMWLLKHGIKELATQYNTGIFK